MILSGELASGMLIPSVRKIATEMKENANNVQHAIIPLIHEGLAENHKGIGYSVTKDKKKIMRRHDETVQRMHHRNCCKVKSSKISFLREMKFSHPPLTATFC